MLTEGEGMKFVSFVSTLSISATWNLELKKNYITGKNIYVVGLTNWGCKIFRGYFMVDNNIFLVGVTVC